MSPCTTSVNEQVVISLLDNETCSLSDTDLFKDYKKRNKIIEIKNSKMYLPNFDIDLIQNSIYKYCNYFEINCLNFVDKFIKDNSTIIDIGANIGNHTLYWANEKNALKIYAFEAIPYTFKILKKNIKINNLEDRVILYNYGLADKTCDGEIKTFCKQNLGGTRLKPLQSDTQFKIPLRTLDSFNIDEKNIDLIKIDVEGMDYEVLRGAENTIIKYKPLIMIEIFPDTYKQSNAFLETLGYERIQDFGSYEYLYSYKQ